MYNFPVKNIVRSFAVGFLKIPTAFETKKYKLHVMLKRLNVYAYLRDHTKFYVIFIVSYAIKLYNYHHNLIMLVLSFATNRICIFYLA